MELGFREWRLLDKTKQVSIRRSGTRRGSSPPLGFADKKGDPKQNQEISLARANAVMEVLENRFHLLNVMHAVGMGSSEMFDAQNFDKNRVVEVWAVLP